MRKWARSDLSSFCKPLFSCDWRLMRRLSSLQHFAVTGKQWLDIHRSEENRRYFFFPVIATESCHSTQQALHNLRRKQPDSTEKKQRKKRKATSAGVSRNTSVKTGWKKCFRHKVRRVECENAGVAEGTFSPGENQWKASALSSDQLSLVGGWEQSSTHGHENP